MKNDPTDHKLPEAIVCPSCGAKNDGALNVDNENQPKEGDLGICVDCWDIAVFTMVNGVLTQRAPTDEERKQAALDPSVTRAITALKAYRIEKDRRL